ncbi:MAG TPA: nucleoside monophosphate kinase [Candidatus Paceibacterota bacterium]|nr:nucleoside monophosphate kinase [Candidatus Paceibacterota bacterium]HOL54023.1 nucleoside monophosphate kinase [Candidatus Paceibacterota bacterium]HON21773.1 nucleoside monophosphate kinase [Candidatus Paceibacterota bacterium]HOV88607.1 nucleoside monophosphate kinase [Candidatus Paceibacterota bacterium]HPP17056.1 nucleoside monophosphate kinase [Candidatus Paceibacterota bacterium]
MKQPKILIFYGPPGAGKDTQARRVAFKSNAIIVSSSKLIEEKIFDPQLQNDPIIQRERKNYESGALCTPEWVTQIINDKVRELAAQKQSLIFTGSPRTMYEAENEIPYWEKVYGKENIHPILITLKPETSLFRNTHRRICEKCGYPVVYSWEAEMWKFCPLCGGRLIDRGVLDDEATIRVRLKEYEERTKPILDYLKERGYQIIEIDGEPFPDVVTQQLFDALVKINFFD